MLLLPARAQERSQPQFKQDTSQPVLSATAFRLYEENISHSFRRQHALYGSALPAIPSGVPGIPTLSTRSTTPLTNSRVTNPANLLNTLRAATCKDSSYRKLTWANNSQHYLACTKKTKDGSILAGGTIRDVTDVPAKFYGLLVKYDSLGNVLWAQKLRGSIGYDMVIEGVTELSDGSLVVAGYYNSVNNPSGKYDAWVSKLTATGTQLWAKTYQSPQASCPSGYQSLKSIAEGKNGEILLAGTIIYCTISTAVKLDASGNMLWNTTFRHMSASSRVDGIYFVNNEAVVFGTSGSFYEYDGMVNVSFLRFDYQTGALLGEKAHKPQRPDFFWYQFAGYEVQTARLYNGHFIIAGNLFDPGRGSAGDTYYFGVLEFDSQYDFVKGYMIGSPIGNFVINNQYINISPTGQLNFVMSRSNNFGFPDLFMGTVQDGQFLKLRKRSFTNTVLPDGSFVPFDDNSYVHLQSYVDVPSSKNYWEFAKMHNSDTSGNISCLGVDSLFASIVPMQYVPYTNAWEYFKLNQLIPTTNDIYDAPVNFYGQDECVQQSWCDTLKLRGPDTLCTGQQPIILTAFKNRECGSWVKWQIPDTSAIDKITYLNDTTVSLQITSSWEGRIRATIDGACAAQEDSLKIFVLLSPNKVDLGKDTSICPSNTLRLNARKGFLTYKWQDGSADSVFMVKQPGKYYVTTTNACGVAYSDTILVAAAPAIPFDLGNDVNKCNGDSVAITAPAGFLNYSWTPAYNVVNTSNQKLVAFPAIDTMYYVAAEKTPGCFAYDSIRVKVNISAVISLGKDTSFCSGDSVVLNAGAGFQSYAWNTGASSQTIVAKAAGTYSIIATAINTCRSKDTLKIGNVFSNPVVQLNKDPLLCMGDSRVLTPGSNFSSYQWQDGSTLPQLTVNTTGTYWVKVTDANHCKGSDTMSITTLQALPKGFLPGDTSLCNYGSLKIVPAGKFSQYAWSTGDNSSSITTSKSGTYLLTVTDQFGCRGTDTLIIVPKECLKGVFVPSAFSPNRDGKNDLFKPVVQGPIVKYELVVYNRWGQRIFATQDKNTGWDGTIGGRTQDTNMFIWTCTYQFDNEPVQNSKGTVTLIR